MKPTIEEINIANNIISLFKEHELDECLKNSYIWKKKYKDFLINNNFEIYCGATKVVIVSEVLSNWVIKIDRNYSKGYCTLEALTYQLAKEKGYEGFFAETYDLSNFKGSSITLQERVNCHKNDYYENFYKYYNDNFDSYGLSETEKYENIDDMEDRDKFLAIFPDEEEVVDWLIDTIDTYCENSDFHEGNFGTTQCGNNVIFDYSGFCLRKEE